MSVRILIGDCREKLGLFSDGYFHCCVTSWPFWGLRDYGIPPTVWGGDPECEHVWEEEIPAISQGGQSDFSTSGLKRDGRPEDGRLRTLLENAKELRRQSPSNSGQFCQRCGAWLGCFGLEPTPELYVQHGVEVSRGVWRVLRDDGTMWLNLGDCYMGSGQGWQKDDNKLSWKRRWLDEYGVERPPTAVYDRSGLKPKDLVGIPWSVAFALQDDGWCLRSAIIWHKPNCIPESVGDRPTNDYEFVFLLAKSQRYFYDQDAIREPQTGNAHSRGHGMNPKGALAERGRDRANDSFHASTADYVDVPGGRNKRAVWTIPTHPFPGAHFATFPPDLVKPCIEAGTSERGACPECGGPWERVREPSIQRGSWHDHENDLVLGQRDESNEYKGANYYRNYKSAQTIDFRPTCSCYDDRYRSEFPRARSARKRWQQDMADRWWPRVRQRPGKDDWPTVPCVVLDPFGGAGTTAMVADRLGRDAVSIDIKPEYGKMSRDRIVGDAGPMFAQVSLE